MRGPGCGKKETVVGGGQARAGVPFSSLVTQTRAHVLLHYVLVVEVRLASETIIPQLSRGRCCTAIVILCPDFSSPSAVVPKRLVPGYVIKSVPAINTSMHVVTTRYRYKIVRAKTYNAIYGPRATTCVDETQRRLSLRILQFPPP